MGQAKSIGEIQLNHLTASRELYFGVGGLKTTVLNLLGSLIHPLFIATSRLI